MCPTWPSEPRQHIVQSAYQVILYAYDRTGEVLGRFTEATVVDAWAPYRKA